MIPQMIIEILKRNEINEDVGLYSQKNQVFYEVRLGILEKVMRQMTRECVNSTIDTLVS